MQSGAKAVETMVNKSTAQVHAGGDGKRGAAKGKGGGSGEVEAAEECGHGGGVAWMARNCANHVADWKAGPGRVIDQWQLALLLRTVMR